MRYRTATIRLQSRHLSPEKEMLTQYKQPFKGLTKSIEVLGIRSIRPHSIRPHNAFNSPTLCGRFAHNNSTTLSQYFTYLYIFCKSL